MEWVSSTPQSINPLDLFEKHDHSQREKRESKRDTNIEREGARERESVSKRERESEREGWREAVTPLTEQ